jgi:hypothetical protein
LVNPNKRQQGELRLRNRESPGGATLNGLIWGAPQAFPSVTALRNMPFLRSAALFLAHVHQVQSAQSALQRNKNGYIATAIISVNRP